LQYRPFVLADEGLSFARRLPLISFLCRSIIGANYELTLREARQMIGFINRDDIPKLFIAVILGGILLVVVGCVLEAFYPHGGSVAATIFLVALAVIFRFSYWAGDVISKRISNRN
jgi:hypothetical protein